MAQYVEVNGQVIEFPDGMASGDIESAIKSNFMSIKPAKAEKPFDPTEGMSTIEKGLAGFGKAIMDTRRGLGQMIPVRRNGQWEPLTTREEVEQARRLDAPLMNTGAGFAGNLIGNAALLAPTALIPGAATVPGAALIGSAAGLAQPSTSTKETLSNVGIGAVAGGAGQAIANQVPRLLRGWQQGAATEAQQAAKANAQKFVAAQTGAAQGYVIPPADLNPGMMSEALSGLSGKIKTAQVASARNQNVTNRLVRESLGVSEDMPLNLDTLNAIRSQAGRAYEAVKSTGTVATNQAYAQALDDAIKPFTSQSSSFPGRKVPAVVDDIRSLKTDAFDAGDAIETIKVLRNDADAAYRGGDKLTGQAYKKAVDALEKAIDDHLVASGAPADLLSNYRGARQTIAKTYTVQNALNPETGAVDALKLARELGKGKPLSGELKSVAEFGTAFPKAAQMLKEAPKATSPLDWAVGAMSGTATGNPLMLAGIAARPAVRNMLLSQPVQRAALNPGYAPSLASRAVPGLIDNEIFRMMAAPAAISGGLLANSGQ